MKRKILLVAASLGAVALSVPAARSIADHVRVTPSGTVYAPGIPQAPAPAPVTVVPAPSTVVVPTSGTVVVSPGPAVTSPVPATIETEQIRADRVRANTIYANRIETDRLKGVIHHTSTVKVNAAQPGEIVGGEVVASVIYADAIAANSIEADNVYVRDLEMSPSQFVIAPLTGTVVRRQSP